MHMKFDNRCNGFDIQYGSYNVGFLDANMQLFMFNKKYAGLCVAMLDSFNINYKVA